MLVKTVPRSVTTPIHEPNQNVKLLHRTGLNATKKHNEKCIIGGENIQISDEATKGELFMAFQSEFAPSVFC